MSKLTADELDVLYRKHAGRLRAQLHARRLEASEIEDVVQDVFVKLLQYCRGRVIDNPKAFLKMVASNLASDRIRRSAASPVSAVENIETVDKPCAAGDPENTVANKQELDGAVAALLALPPLTQRVFLLHRFDNLSYAAIARRLDLSVSVVRTHIKKAVMQIALYRRQTYEKSDG